MSKKKNDVMNIEIKPKMLVTSLLALVFIASILTNGFDTSYAGEVEIIGLVDKSCENCYPVTVHSNIMISQHGVPLSEMEIVDINSGKGKELVEKFNINYIPTVIMSNNLKKFPIAELWSQLGTIEDGWYVFRSTASMNNFGVYKNLATGEEILPSVTITKLTEADSCSSPDTVDIKLFMSASCDNCEQEIEIMEELKTEFGNGINVTYVAAPRYTINQDGSINNTDINDTMALEWFDISWNESQKIINENLFIFQNTEVIDNSTKYILIPANPFFIFNCNEIRPTYLLPREIQGKYPKGTEKTDLKNTICKIIPSHEACSA